MCRVSYTLAAYAVALAAALAIFLLIAPAQWQVAVGLGEEPKPAATGGWGAATGGGQQTAAAPQPIPLEWMAWTPQTGAFFLFVLMCLSLMTAREFWSPGGHPRRGALGLDTTRGDRLFITLLGSAFIFLGWLGLMGTPLWGGLAIALIWAVFVFGWV